MTKLDNIIWEIEPEESRMRNEKMIRVAVFGLLGLLGYVLIEMFLEASASSSFSGFLYFFLRSFLFVSLFVLVPAFIVYLINKNIKHSRRSYLLDLNGVEIIIDGMKEKYSWDDFISFYDYSKHSLLLYFRINEAKVNGGIFYLRKKTGFFNRFVIVHSEPDSSRHVYGFLLDHLKEEV